MFPGPGAKGSIVTNDDVDVLMIFSLGTWTGYGIQSNHVSTIINPPKSRLGRFSKNLLMKVVIDLQYTTWLDPSTWWPAEISHTFFLLLRDWSAFFINCQKKTKHYSLGYRSLLITSSLNRSNGVWKLTIAMVSLIIVTHRNLCCTLTVSKYTHVLHIPRCTESIKKKTWSVIQDLELMNFTKKKKAWRPIHHTQVRHTDYKLYKTWHSYDILEDWKIQNIRSLQFFKPFKAVLGRRRRKLMI